MLNRFSSGYYNEKVGPEDFIVNLKLLNGKESSIDILLSDLKNKQLQIADTFNELNTEVVSKEMFTYEKSKFVIHIP